MDVNKVILAGNLTRDPEMKEVANGSKMTRFSIASNRNFKTRDGEKKQETLFSNIVAWSGQAETCAKYLNKGSKVLVVGRLTSREFEGKEGNKIRINEIVAEEVQFLSSKPSNNNDSDAGDSGSGGW